MKIVINTAHQRFGGAVQVALSFIHECRAFPEHEYFVWVGPGVKNSLKLEEFPDNFNFQFFDFGPITFRKTFRIHRMLKQAENAINPDVIIATSGPTYFRTSIPQIIGYNLGLYLYTDSPFFQNRSLKDRIRFFIKRKLHFHFFKHEANAYVVQTDDVKKRVRQALKTDQVYTVTNTPSAWYRMEILSFPDKLPPKRSDVFRWLTVSSYYGHKNLELIPKVQDELEILGIDNVEFILTLEEGDFHQHIGQQRGIINVGPVPPVECPSLYRECDGMFLPTLAECFSASYPEAMIMEKPIVTTDLGFAHSICGRAALYYSPQNAAEAAKAILKLIQNEGLQKELIEKGKDQLRIFDTPKERARKYLKICEKYAKPREG
ncbi:glycosyltransferase [Pleomorphovibrio marinus]|uniref:glycosyltransferase n=1 Tax=Pleomorphovibrio marinus TaxID=2164132 RepID=UPI000E0C330C|nr:glycosyltransferase [Pleomorphovibrio marinus]